MMSWRVSTPTGLPSSVATIAAFESVRDATNAAVLSHRVIRSHAPIRGSALGLSPSAPRRQPVSKEFAELVGLYPYLRNRGRFDQVNDGPPGASSKLAVSRKGHTQADENSCVVAQ